MRVLSAAIGFAVLAPAPVLGEMTSYAFRRDPSKSNPDLSAVGLFLGRYGNQGHAASAERANGFHLQEAEFRATANVDPYFLGDFIVAAEREPGKDFKVKPEMAYVDTLAIPHATIRAGKFKALLGRHNELHRHAFPFIDAPLPHEEILGEEGLNEAGVAAAILLPAPWYLEVTPQVFSAGSEKLFGSSSAGEVLGLGLLKSVWDVTDSMTIELDLAYGRGGNRFQGRSDLYDLAYTYKWRPVEQAMYRSVSWTVELLQAHRGGASENQRVGGATTWLQAQFARHWWAQGRFEVLGIPAPDDGEKRKVSGLIGYVPTEYSALRLQYDNVRSAGPPEHRLSLQLNVSIGAHPAHLY